MTPRRTLRGSLEEPLTLARLADGSARPHEHAQLAAFLASSSEAQLRLARQRRVVATIRAGGPELPMGLRHWLNVADMTQAGGTRPRRRPGASWNSALAAAASVVAIILVVGLQLFKAHPSSRPPTVRELALLAFRGPTDPAPPANPDDRALLKARLGGVTFPDYARRFNVRATGQRNDRVGGRNVRTVYYSLLGGTTMSYSVVSGRELTAPVTGFQVMVNSAPLHVYRERGLQIVTLVRHGRTCVLAATAAESTLVTLARAGNHD
jgi:hypothetical protein